MGCVHTKPKEDDHGQHEGTAAKAQGKGSFVQINASATGNSATKEAPVCFPKVRVLKGHTQPVTCVCASAGGQFCISGQSALSVKDSAAPGEHPATLRGRLDLPPVLTTGSEDQTVRAWDIDSGACRAVLEGHKGDVNAVALSADGGLAVSGGDDMTVRVWNLLQASSNMSRSADNVPRLLCCNILYGHTGFVSALALTPDSKLCVSCSDDTSVRVWDVSGSPQAPCKLTLTGHTATVSSIAMAPSGRNFVTGADLSLHVWDLSQGKCITMLTGHTNTITCISLASDGHTLVSASRDLTLRVWDIRPEITACIQTISGLTQIPAAVGITPLANTILASISDKLIMYKSSGDLQTMLSGHTGIIRGLSVFGKQGQRVVSGGCDNTVRVWSLNGRSLPVEGCLC